MVGLSAVTRFLAAFLELGKRQIYQTEGLLCKSMHDIAVLPSIIILVSVRMLDEAQDKSALLQQKT